MNDERLSIGRFARLTGLSINALRHYDELGLLRPAGIDPTTAYRSYSRAQLDEARTIARLRDLDVPLPKVAAYLAADTDTRREILARHRADVEARTSRQIRITHHLNQVIDAGDTLMNAPSTDRSMDPADERRIAIALFNHVWTLMETTDRTPEQTDEMIHAAHASRYHWGNVGDASNRARGEWQVSRVYAVLGRGEPALWHATRCLAICDENGIGDWDLGFAYEALARASRVSGDLAGRDRYLAEARTAATQIKEDEDRQLLDADLATV
jgi:DNA-binding transcriptional MerR regulator